MERAAAWSLAIPRDPPGSPAEGWGEQIPLFYPSFSQQFWLNLTRGQRGKEPVNAAHTGRLCRTQSKIEKG